MHINHLGGAIWVGWRLKPDMLGNDASLHIANIGKVCSGSTVITD